MQELLFYPSNKKRRTVLLTLSAVMYSFTLLVPFRQLSWACPP